MASKKILKVKINKTAFVLEHPKLAAKEVVALAKKEHKAVLSEKYVYNIRAKAKKNGGERRKPGRPPSKVNGSKVSTAERRALAADIDAAMSAASDRTDDFVSIVMEIGSARAEELLRTIKAGVTAFAHS
jgi:hypothetical protein